MKRHLITTNTSPRRRGHLRAAHQSAERVAQAALVALALVVIGGCGEIRLRTTPPEPESPPIAVNVRTLPTFANSFRSGFDSDLGGSLGDTLLDAVEDNTGGGGTNQAPIIQFRELPRAFVNPVIESTERHFTLGIVPLGAPGPGTTIQRLDQAISRAGEVAECFVLRQQVDWEAFRPRGTGVAELTEDLVDLVTKARSNGFTQILIEMDPVVSRIAIGPLPPALRGQDFGSLNIRSAMKAQANEIVRRVHPEFLSFAVEANGYHEADPDDFQDFVSLHKEMYDSVKAISPETQVLASFNLEGIQGLFRGLNPLSDHGPEWFLLDLFEPKVDAFSFSTLPFPVFFEAVGLPSDYLSQIQDHTDRDIILSEIGWTTAIESNSNQQQQTDYLALVTRQALRFPQLRVMAWTILFDAEPGSIFDLFPPFAKLGLLELNGDPKSVFPVWTRLLDTPLVEIQP